MKGTITEQIRDALMMVDGVIGPDEIEVRFYEHFRIEVTVDGGEPHAICAAIFRSIPAGFTTFGALGCKVTDSEGVSHEVRFDRWAKPPRKFA